MCIGMTHGALVLTSDDWLAIPSETAVHEAGHAVVAVSLGVVCLWIEVVPPAELVIGAPAAYVQLARRGRLNALDEAVIDYAGPAAQRRVTTASLERLLAEAATDFAHMHRLLGGSNARFDIAAMTAEALVTKHWPAIVRLAERIDKGGSIYRDELEALGLWWAPSEQQGEADWLCID